MASFLQSSWINTFDADVAHIPDHTLINAYSRLNYSSDALRSGAQYGDARFVCPSDFLLDLRSTEQGIWVYRFFGAYDNVVGPPNTAPTHGTEVPFFHGGNECFEGLQGVTEEQQALAAGEENVVKGKGMTECPGQGLAGSTERMG